MNFRVNLELLYHFIKMSFSVSSKCSSFLENVKRYFINLRRMHQLTKGTSSLHQNIFSFINLSGVHQNIRVNFITPLMNSENIRITFVNTPKKKEFPTIPSLFIPIEIALCKTADHSPRSLEHHVKALHQ